ncbi:glycosyltransferase family 2 protein [Halodesulfurarchaeum formicicum]|uniref:Glycosyl transferase family 2 n=1 Tax=Halodesulfurarchaeum formicicum TaxID=1873524 RepID=A0A1J1AB14_9EURY|nr:glycosyltransferase family 2 protein [Halodesulfurarchaeum formicicum]APE95326.1 glycosyl transferase family 2 [Halodesulfurarchaeum formicicum]
MSTNKEPHVTVIVTAYDPERFPDINEGVQSILDGNYSERDVIVVVDGREELGKRLRDRWEDKSAVSILVNETNVGAASSRNRAVAKAEGEIVAFFDDDAVADEDWLQELVRCYTEYDAVAAGGKMVPIWIAGHPQFLPPEFYWLIGVTYAGHPEEMTEVRNTFASNLSVKKSVFDEIGGFNSEIGPKGGSLLQSAETDLCGRIAEETGHGVLYNPDAEVGHKVYEFRTDPVFLLKRAFWQGVSKRGMQVYSETELESESDFLKNLVTSAVPSRLKQLVRGERLKNLQQLGFLLFATVSVGLGYVYGFSKFRNA